MCEGQAPPADVQAGVCAGAVKVCGQDAGGAWDWREPDYASIAGHEAAEVTCDGLDNDCDTVVDEGFTLGAQCGTTDVGPCEYGTTVCTADGLGTECAGNVEPAPETCDGLDNDCDTVIDNGVTTDFYPDLDGDTYGDASAAPVAACAAPADHVADHSDCNDGDSAINPGAPEHCDGIDNNCDTAVDEGFTLGAQCGTTDVGPCEYGTTVCTADGLGTECAGNVEPGFETCDGLDNDCDTVIDNGVTTDYYPDTDGDTYGDASAAPVAACAAPADHVADHSDCNDGNNAVHPGAAERCNGLDDNCDTIVDDGFSLGTQCGTTDVGPCEYGSTVCTADGLGTECAGNVEPGFETCDGLDNDCDTVIDNGVTTDYYPDTDGDTYGDASAAPVAACAAPADHVTDHSDCNDGNNAVHPGAAERCNGLDDNCDTLVDDGFSLGVQCGSTDAGACEYGSTVCTADGLGTECAGNVEPDFETCDGLDNDCDTIVDNGVTTDFYPDIDGDGFGDALGTPVAACAPPPGHVDNNLDCDDTRNDVHPGAAELCDSLDNDCDTIVDEDLTELAWYPDLDGDSFGDATAAPVMNCANPGGLLLDHTDCNDADDTIHPGAAEICNGIDDNCSGAIDEALVAPLCAQQNGVCAGARQTCGGSAGWLACTNANYLAWNAAYEPVETTCDTLDNDCDGSVDEGVKTDFYPDADGDTYGSAV
ncbi:putative metal-binding motif-containing protein, partial [Myxococcota bacterium]|nr:putative metal-binding motif-containing protein [Myxococcota bacterium]